MYRNEFELGQRMIILSFRAVVRCMWIVFGIANAALLLYNPEFHSFIAKKVAKAQEIRDFLGFC